MIPQRRCSLPHSLEKALQIANLKVGDKVFAKNEITGITTYQTVQAHYSNPYEFTVYISVKDSKGVHQTIVSNKIHPFFTQVWETEKPIESEGHHYTGDIQNAYWVNAENLKVGYKLLGENNQWQEVEHIEIKAEKLKAFNLTVANDHTYFIKGLGQNAAGVWVHNDCWLNLPSDAIRSGKTTPDGRELYTFKDHTGKSVSVYKGTDGRYYDQKIHSPEKPTAVDAKVYNPYPNRDGDRAVKGKVYYETNKEAAEAALALGFEKIAEKVNGQQVFYNKKTKKYISRDVGSNDGNGSHNGGVWKMASSIKELANKDTRLGTYDAKLNKIGD